MEWRPSRKLLLLLRSSQPPDLVAVPYLGEESFCIKKISVSCLRARRKKIYHYYRLRRKKKKERAGSRAQFLFIFFDGGALPGQSKTLIEWRHTPYGGD